MALKKDGTRTMITLTIKKVNKEKLSEIAKKEKKSLGKILDKLIEERA